MNDEKPNLSRRGALRLIATTAAAVPVLGCSEKKVERVVEVASEPVDPTPQKTVDIAAPRSATDPDLLNPTVAWDLVLEEKELAILAALCDVIIPADDHSPGASALGAQDYINEYVSAPYDSSRTDLVTVRGGIVWLNSESRKRFDRVFIELSATQKQAICDDIKWEKTAEPEFQAAARFFTKIRNLTATAFYTTDEGMADIGYVGNTPTAKFSGPPQAVLQKLGLNS